MAVSIDRVYQTVQKILNKEQRGYLPPVEFNLFANQAQIEIFENYFYDLDAYMQGGSNDSDYGDIIKNLGEKIHAFDNVATVTEAMAHGVEQFSYPANFYRLGQVTLNNIIVDEVSHKELAYVELSPLTAPTRKQPVYTRHEGGVVLRPEMLMPTDVVRMIYIRQPAAVSWAYMNVNGNPVYNAGPSTDFELHPSELTSLIFKICALSGVAIRSIDVSQIIQQEEAAYMAELKQ